VWLCCGCGERGRVCEREKVGVCECVCVCVRERQKENMCV